MKRNFNNKSRTYSTKLYIYIALILSLLKTTDLQAQHFLFYKTNEVNTVMPTLHSEHTSHSNAENIGVLNIFAVEGDVLVLFVAANQKTVFVNPFGWTLIGKNGISGMASAAYWKLVGVGDNGNVTIGDGNVNRKSAIVLKYKNANSAYNFSTNSSVGSGGGGNLFYGVNEIGARLYLFSTINAISTTGTDSEVVVNNITEDVWKIVTYHNSEELIKHYEWSSSSGNTIYSTLRYKIN